MTKLSFVLALILPIVVSGLMVVTLPSQPLLSKLAPPARIGQAPRTNPQDPPATYNRQSSAD
jgi:hypothetical protein